jgi:hypothetical protein
LFISRHAEPVSAFRSIVEFRNRDSERGLSQILKQVQDNKEQIQGGETNENLSDKRRQNKHIK